MSERRKSKLEKICSVIGFCKKGIYFSFAVLSLCAFTFSVPVEAIGGERAAMLMPFDAGGRTWINGEGPGQHHHSISNAWATDLHSTIGTAVKPRLQTSDGTITMSVAAITNTCAPPNSAGQSVWVNVSVDGTYAGRVVYGHLDNLQVSVGNAVNVGTTLGYLKLWDQSTCWADTLADGLVHTHVEASKACYRNLAAQTNYSASTPVGMLSSDYTDGNVSVCDENDISQVMSSGSASTPHLTIIQNHNSPTGMTEAKKLDANTNYTSWIGGWVTPDGAHSGADVDYGMADYNSDGIPDLYKIQHQNTNSGMTEVQVMNGATNYTTWLGGWVTPDGLHSSNDVHYAVVDYNRDGKPDVYAIQHWNTGTGKIEVRVMNGATNNTSWLGGWVTPEGWHGGDDVDFVVSNCGAGAGAPHLYEVLHNNTGSGHVEVKQLDGSTNYTSFVGGWVTPEGMHSGNDVKYTAAGCNTNGKPNIYEIQNGSTASGMTEVKALNGAANFGSWLGGWVTPDGVHSGNDVDFVMPG